MSVVNRIVPLIAAGNLCTCPVCNHGISLFDRELAYHSEDYNRSIALGQCTTIAHMQCGLADNAARKQKYWVFERPEVNEQQEAPARRRRNIQTI